jgi:hypothetical protein
MSFILLGILNSAAGERLPALQGGIVTESGGFIYHTFTSSDDLIVNVDTECDYLIVGGGGGGGFRQSGQGSNVGSSGAGGGGVRFLSSTLTAGTYAVTVGAGGSSPFYAETGNRGGTSSLGAVASATGGGAGSDANSANAATTPNNGGSGGGGRRNNGTAGTGNLGGYSPAEGQNGGRNTSSTNAGAGGGAGQTPSSGSTTGGNGLQYSTIATAIGLDFQRRILWWRRCFWQQL